MSTEHTTDTPQTRAVEAVLAAMLKLYDSFGLEELADEVGARVIAAEVLRTSRWNEEILHVLRLPDGSHVGVVTQEGLTEYQEDPSPDTWEVVAVEGRERVVTKWSVR